MGHNSYRGIEVAMHSMSDAFYNMEKFAEGGKEEVNNEYEIRAIRPLAVSCAELLALYFDAVDNGWAELNKNDFYDLFEKMKNAMNEDSDE
jgi:hypothetical protein